MIPRYNQEYHRNIRHLQMQDLGNDALKKVQHFIIQGHNFLYLHSFHAKVIEHHIEESLRLISLDKGCSREQMFAGSQHTGSDSTSQNPLQSAYLGSVFELMEQFEGLGTPLSVSS